LQYAEITIAKLSASARNKRCLLHELKSIFFQIILITYGSRNARKCNRFRPVEGVKAVSAKRGQPSRSIASVEVRTWNQQVTTMDIRLSIAGAPPPARVSGRLKVRDWTYVALYELILLLKPTSFSEVILIHCSKIALDLRWISGTDGVPLKPL